MSEAKGGDKQQDDYHEYDPEEVTRHAMIRMLRWKHRHIDAPKSRRALSPESEHPPSLLQSASYEQVMLVPIKQTHLIHNACVITTLLSATYNQIQANLPLTYGH